MSYDKAHGPVWCMAGVPGGSGLTFSGVCACCARPDLVRVHSNSLDHTSVFRNGTDFLAICEQVGWGRVGGIPP